MRKVDHDELVFVIYHELRNWGVGYRRAIFKPSPDPRARPAETPAKMVATVLRRVEVIDTARPAVPLTVEELTALFVRAIDAFPGAIGKLWLSRSADRETEARTAAANLLADALAPFFVLSSGKEMEPRPQYPRLEVKPHAMLATWP
ncbi:hypothetical protein [Sphingomonas leidyi]|jgi:hypothetical protein|uniref:hypothetical protein n=1 Tax=Sphingomonas leidyi TaxID=68569 RepID=UPI0036D313CE